MKNGTYSEANQLKFGWRLQAQFYVVKLKFKNDIAEWIAARLVAQNVSITPLSNKGERTIYGYCTAIELERLLSLKYSAKAKRLRKEADLLEYQASMLDIL